MRTILAGLLVWAIASVAWAGNEIGRGPAPDWVRSTPAPTSTTLPNDGDAFRIELIDQQMFFSGQDTHTYVRARTAVYSPQALTALGHVSVLWNPGVQDVTVHSVEILRGEQRIDVLQGREFVVLRREQNFEAAVIDGLLTGTLQIDGLRVGDRIEWAYSTVSHMPVLGDHAEFRNSAAFPVIVDQYSFRAVWPTSRPLRLQVSGDWDAPPVRRRGDQSFIEIHLENLEPVEFPADAPMRFYDRRRLEGTNFSTWGELSALFAPLYSAGTVIAPDSSLREEVDRIRAAHVSKKEQVLAALRLVQDEVRYLALAMGEGGLLPASAEETWARRLGDCKGKTVLLLGILNELGVEARAVLVSTMTDNLDERLPTVAAFDHVIVQAEVDGETAWLDGTRTGDRTLVPLTPLQFGWVLPLQARDASLLHLQDKALAQPLREVSIQLDLKAGLYVSGPVTGEEILRGDRAVALQSVFSVATLAQRNEYMRELWSGLIDDPDIAEVNSAYDEDRNELKLTMSGKAALDWSTGGVRRAEIPVSLISWSAGDARAEGPFKDAPFLTGYPGFTRFRTTIALPDGGEGFTVSGVDVDEEVAGRRHRRSVSRDGDRIVMERDIIVVRPEMTEAERAAAVEPLRRLQRSRAEILAPASYAPTAGDFDALSLQQAGSVEQLIARGLALSHNQMSDEAIVAFDLAIEQDPESANAYANRGIVRFWSGDIELAAADFEKALEIDPNERIGMNGRGLIAMREERYVDAAVEFSMALRAAPNDVFGLMMRGSAYANLKQWDRALADIGKVKALDPDSVEASLAEIGLLIMAERFEEGAVAANLLAEHSPDDVRVRQAQASVLEETGDLTGAEAALTAALDVESDHPVMLIDRAVLRLKSGDGEGARADMALARPLAVSSAGLLNNLCWEQALAGFDLDQALADCDAALALRPTNAPIIDSRAFVLLRLGRTSDALKAYDEALNIEPNLGASLYGRSLVKRALGDDSGAEADRRAALAISADVAKPFAPYEERQGIEAD